MATREGSLDAPTRHPLDWQAPDFWSKESLEKELERVFDICHGCRRCFNLCNSFPTLFDAVDASPTGEVDGVPKAVFAEVVDHCYLCDMCYMSKCPYVPPASLQRGLSPPDAARQGRAFPGGGRARCAAGSCRPPTRWAASPAFRWWPRW